jgi:predicted secreted protein
MQFDESANGQAAKLKENDLFEIALPEVRTAGYRWTLKSGRGAACTLVEETSSPSTGVHGGASQHCWKFRATSPGSCEIELHYARSWETSSEPAKTFRLKVEVRP